jgi:hypothetical protein
MNLFFNHEDNENFKFKALWIQRKEIQKKLVHGIIGCYIFAHKNKTLGIG